MGKRSKSREKLDIKTGILSLKPKGKKSEPVKLVIEEKKLHELAFLASIINSSDDAIIGKTLDGIVTSWNPAAEKIFGYAPKEVIGKPVSILIPVDLQKEEREIIKKIKHGKSIDHYETKRLKKDGCVIDVLLTISPIRDSSGNIVGAAKILRDITARKKTEGDLIHVNEQLNVSLKEAADYKHALDESSIVAITEKSGIIKYVNDNFCKISKYSREELIGKDHRIINSGYHPKEFIRELWATISQGKIWKGELKNKARDGSIYWVDTTIVPFLDDQGKPYQYVAIRSEITSRKKAEEEVIKAYQEKETVLNRISDGVVSVDNEWRYTFLNDAALSLPPRRREETLGKVLWEVHPEIVGTVFWEKHQEALRTRKVVEIESFYPPMNIWFSVKVYPSSNGLTIFYKDISDRKKAEAQLKQLNEGLEQKVIERTAQLEASLQELRESEEKFQKAFRASGGGITITRLADATYMDVNEAFAQITGYTREELIGHTSVELGIVLNVKKRDEVLQEVKRHGSASNFEITVRHKSGRQLEVISSVATILLKGEEYAINIIYDITDRKIAEEQLSFANKEMESFSYSVSHDLRAPLRAINGNAKILEEDYLEKFDADGLSALQSIIRNSKRMGVLIDDLLAFSKLGRKPVTRSVIDMMTLVKSIVGELVTDDIEGRTEIKVDVLPPASGDPSLVKQVWVNLISNAIKYSKNKSRTEIVIGAHEKEGMIVYHVKDNGAGFDMLYYDKLFGVFQRLHSTEEFEGTGIGLANVQKIVHRHKGTVWAESKPNEGACFYFSLPHIQSSLYDLNA
jgi:PAS domain S-box-containing protein